MANEAPITLAAVFRWKQPWGECPWQDAAVPLLEESLRLQGYEATMRRDQPWYELFSQKQPPSDSTASPASAEPTPASEVLLDVPYEWQLDNAGGQGYRECFSSSCAMVARYWKRVESDDAYNQIRAKYGDSTSSEAQVRALAELRLQARLMTNATPAVLEREIRARRPVAVGWLHKGPVDAPVGGGHWTVVRGFTETQWIMNDPNGEADLVNGGYVSHQGGAGVAYSRQNWEPRWLVEGPATGWALLVEPI